MKKNRTDEEVAGRRSIWRSRGRRFAVAVNTWVAVALAFVLLLLVNHLAHRYPQRWDLSRSGYYRLSEKTRSMLAGMEGRLEMAAFFRKNHILCDDVQRLLKEYEFEGSKNAKLDLSITIVDPDRDLAGSRELAAKYDVQDANLVVFEKEGRRKYVEATDIADYALTMEKGGAFTRLVGFKAEQAFSSAMLNVDSARQPKVYFLVGHGERDIAILRKKDGYSQLARMMRRDNIQTESLLLATLKSVPRDCAALVIPGPDRPFMQEEVDLLSEYLAKGGRVFFLLDPAVRTGLEPLLEKWGVLLARDVVVDPRHTLTGRELIVGEYGDHAITRSLHNVATVFYMPRSVTPAEQRNGNAQGHADRPRVTVLASSGPEGWAEKNLAESPFTFDAQSDTRGPVAVAVSVELGETGGIEVGIKPPRLLVVGDSDFVSNGALDGSSGNLDFFLGGMNWLIERNELIAVGAKSPLELRLTMNRTQLRLTTVLIVVAMPLLLTIIGAMVGRARRY